MSYTRGDIRRALSKLPIDRGDILFCHSNLGFFGSLEGSESVRSTCEAFFDEIMATIGPSGTLIVPTFTYSFQNGETFDVASTPSKMGVFAEWCREHEDSARTFDPCYSVAAIGRNAGVITAFPPENSFDANASIFSKIVGAGGKILNLNFDAGSTLIHFAERCCGVPYRYDKTFTGTLTFSGRGLTQKNIIFVRYKHPGLIADFEKFNDLALKNDSFRTADLGRGKMGVISAIDTYMLVKEGLSADPWFLTAAGKIGYVPTDYTSLL